MLRVQRTENPALITGERQMIKGAKRRASIERAKGLPLCHKGFPEHVQSGSHLTL